MPVAEARVDSRRRRDAMHTHHWWCIMRSLVQGEGADAFGDELPSKSSIFGEHLRNAPRGHRFDFAARRLDGTAGEQPRPNLHTALA